MYMFSHTYTRIHVRDLTPMCVYLCMGCLVFVCLPYLYCSLLISRPWQCANSKNLSAAVSYYLLWLMAKTLISPITTPSKPNARLAVCIAWMPAHLNLSGGNLPSDNCQAASHSPKMTVHDFNLTAVAKYIEVTCSHKWMPFNKLFDGNSISYVIRN